MGRLKDIQIVMGSLTLMDASSSAFSLQKALIIF